MNKEVPETKELAEMIAGSISAFNSIYKRYFRSVYANIFKLVKSPESAEDIAQDVFVSLWQNRSQLGADRPIKGWLFVVSYNKSLSFLKSELKKSVFYIENYEAFETLLPQESTGEEALTRKIASLEKAIETLSGRKKEVFTMCRIEGKSKTEVASLLGIAPSSVADYLKEAHKLIRKYVKSNDVVPDMILLIASFCI